MRSRVLVVITVGLYLMVSGTCIPLGGKTAEKINDATDPALPGKQDIDVDGYLERFGYIKPLLKPNDPERPVQHSEVERSLAIRMFQKFADLTETGVMNKETVAKMAEPRCGFPDMYLEDESQQTPIDYTAIGRKWADNRVSWRVSNYSPKLPQTEQWRAFDRAFAYWSDVSGLRVTSTQRDADIDIRFAEGNHQDGVKNSFDGPGGVFAHAFLPSDGRVHFDDEEPWQYHSNEGVELETVAAHEFGHALGLSHSRNRGALMAPFYRDFDPDFRLPDDDVQGIQTLYGLPPEVTSPVPAREPVARRNESDCLHRIDAITQGPDNFYYLFTGKLVYKLEEKCIQGSSCVVPGFPKSIRQVYMRAPSNIAAAAYVPDERKRTYFFKGRKIWRYTRFNLDKGYPKLLSEEDMPEKPYAAYVHKNQFADYQLYIFGAKHFWEINLYNEKISNVKMKVKTYWDHFPHRPSAITQARDGNIYVFKGKYYRKYDHFRSFLQRKKVTSPSWLGGSCGYAPK